MKKNNFAPFIFKTSTVCLPLMILAFSSCSELSRHSDAPNENPPLVEDKYRLSADREAFAKLREEIPEEKKKENDEIAFVQQMMAELRHRPSEVREKFNTALRKKRESFNKDMKKHREDFTKAEKTERDKMVKDLEVERKEFMRRKVTADQRKDFFQENEAHRKDFYSSQREKREEFEAEIRNQRKNFEDYAREKNNDFNQEHRAYSKRYDEMKKEEENKKKELKEQASLRTGSPSNSLVSEKSVKVLDPSAYGITAEDLEKAFEDAKSKPGQPLEPAGK